ncbi:hypothetical protein V8E55_003999 [Tylopilus felleus]
MKIGDYTCHVLVNDKELEEYCVKFETPTRTTCWIPSEEGKTFGIEWHCDTETRTKGSVGWVKVDGILCGGSPMFPGPRGDDDTAEMYCITTETKTRDFLFVRIELGDDECLLNKETPEGFGEISLEIEHGRLVKDRRRVRQTDMGVPDESDKFHETSNKAAHHRIGFGPEKDCPPKRVSCLRVNDEPSLFFIFKYRPMALLQAHGLAPRPLADADNKSPSPQPDLGPPRSLSNNVQKVELQQRIQNLRNELKRLEDLEASEEPRRKRIKTENCEREKQFHPTVSQVVVDLTED